MQAAKATLKKKLKLLAELNSDYSDEKPIKANFEASRKRSSEKRIKILKEFIR